MRVGKFVFAVVFMSVVAGCAVRNEYIEPAGEDASSAARLRGSTVHQEDILDPDSYAYVGRIDDRPTMGGPRSWDDPILVPPGDHTISVGVAFGGLSSIFGFSDVIAKFEADRTYTIRSTYPRELEYPHWESIVWIEDDKGTAVSERIPVRLGVARPAFIYIP